MNITKVILIIIRNIDNYLANFITGFVKFSDTNFQEISIGGFVNLC